MRQTIIIVTIATKQKVVQRISTSRTSRRSWRVWWALLPLLLPKLLVCNIGLPGNPLLQRMCWQSVWESDWSRLHKCFRFKFAQTNSRVTEQKFGFHKQQQQHQKITSTSNHRWAVDNWGRLCWTPAKSRSCIVFFLLTKEYFIQFKKLI